LITIKIDDREIRQAFTGLIQSAKNPRPILAQLGEILLDSTRKRFATSTAPDGTPWAPNSAATMIAWLQKKSGKFEGRKRIGDKDGYFHKKGDNKGRLALKGVATVMDKRVLIGETTNLSRQIFPVVGDDYVQIGSDRPYAAMQQFGGSKSEFTHLWGDIPARPFMGISDQDKQNILDTIAEHLHSSLK
jgi:phage gpG-like protein